MKINARIITDSKNQSGNFKGFIQYRKTLLNKNRV